jgi:outer membrane immunogenic protein
VTPHRYPNFSKHFVNTDSRGRANPRLIFVPEDYGPRGQIKRGRLMRGAICALLVLGFASSAFADEFDSPVVPGWQPLATASFMNWRGFYVGGQASYSGASANFANTTQGPIAYALRGTTLESEFAPSNWQVLGSASHVAAGYGGFVGYNIQFERLVVGVEANYDQAMLSLLAPNSPISRVTPADSQGDSYLVNITGSGSVTNLNFGTLRARAGWALGNFLPYAFAGLAIGEADVNIAATVSGQQNPPAGGGACNAPCTPFSFTGTGGTNSEWLYGFTVGAGVDVALTRNIFLRAEYEFVQFAPTANPVINVNSGRVGAGFKF